MIFSTSILQLFCLLQLIEPIRATGQQRYKIFSGKSVKVKSSSATTTMKPSNEGI